MRFFLILIILDNPDIYLTYFSLTRLILKITFSHFICFFSILWLMRSCTCKNHKICKHRWSFFLFRNFFTPSRPKIKLDIIRYISIPFIDFSFFNKIFTRIFLSLLGFPICQTIKYKLTYQNKKESAGSNFREIFKHIFLYI